MFIYIITREIGQTKLIDIHTQFRYSVQAIRNQCIGWPKIEEYNYEEYVNMPRTPGERHRAVAVFIQKRTCIVEYVVYEKLIR